MATGPGADRGQRQLVEVDRRGIGDGHFVRLRANEPGDLAADARRRVDPALVPTADETVAPLCATASSTAARGQGKRPSELPSR
ncbi:MAG: hypothetical protein R2851_01820 [Caldilineaceae bacterium]